MKFIQHSAFHPHGEGKLKKKPDVNPSIGSVWLMTDNDAHFHQHLIEGLCTLVVWRNLDGRDLGIVLAP
jgi:hypothetical protein